MERIRRKPSEHRVDLRKIMVGLPTIFFLSCGSESGGKTALDAGGGLDVESTLDAHDPDSADAAVEARDAELIDFGTDAELGDVDQTQDAESQDALSGPDATRGQDAELEDAATTCAQCWRSALYPVSWTPDRTEADGKFLHDFSYAGYHHGDWPPSLPPRIVEVSTFAVDPTGVSDSTEGFQSAIDEAGALGGAVVLIPAGHFRIDGLIEITHSYTVLKGSGRDRTFLWLARGSNMTDRSNILFRGNVRTVAQVPLTTNGVNRSSSVEVTNGFGLEAGLDVSLGFVISDAFVADHAMDGFWTPFRNVWKPIFRRELRAVTSSVGPSTVEIDVPLRYDLKVRDGAELRVETGYLSEVGLESLSISSATSEAEAWASDRASAVGFEGVKDGWVQDVGSFDAEGAPGSFHLASGGIRVVSSKRVTIAETRLEKAQNRGSGGNGYLFEVSRSNEVLIRDSQGLEGRHNFIQNWDFGTTGCVFLRIESAAGRMVESPGAVLTTPGYSEYHHALAMANLVDSSVIRDGWYGGNRREESSGAGHTTTQNVYWNLSGGGLVTSAAFGMAYVIGPGDLNVLTRISALLPLTRGTEPEDHVERAPGPGWSLEPSSLYESQRAARLHHP